MHDEEVAVTSRDAHANFLRLMKTLLPTSDSSIRERPDSIDSNILTPDLRSVSESVAAYSADAIMDTFVWAASYSVGIG